MKDKEQKIVTNIYAALSVALLMSFVPMMSAAVLATLMFMGVLVASYFIRRKADPASLTADHMTFIIRTIWIASFFALITMGAAIAYVLNVYDPSSVAACANNLAGAIDQASMMAAIQPCMNEFMAANMRYFINGAIIGAGPVVIYFVYRLAKGLARAVKGHRIGDNKSWF